MPTTDCPICCNAVTPSRQVRCPYCDHLSCRTCVETYLTSNPDDPNCMHCRRIFDRATLVTLLPRTFVEQRLKRHREQTLLERETAMMPATRPYVEQEMQRRSTAALEALGTNAVVLHTTWPFRMEPFLACLKFLGSRREPSMPSSLWKESGVRR